MAVKKGRGGARPGAGRKKGPVTPVKKELVAAAREHALDMLTVLVGIAKDTEQPASARVSAATHVIERGHGKAIAPVEHGAANSLQDAFAQLLGAGSKAVIKSSADK